MTDPDAIAKRAYELFLERGSDPGHEVDDWLQAEAELNYRAAAETGVDHVTNGAGAADQDEAPGASRSPGQGQDRDQGHDRSARKRNNGARRSARQPDTR
jgi:hypothetical protein